LLVVGFQPAAYADVWAEVRAANQAIEAWDYVEAKQRVGTLRQTHPEHPGVRFVGGKLDFHLGDYDRAVQELEAARDGVPSQVMHALNQLLDLVTSTRDLVQNYEHYVSPDGHFEIRHEARDA